MTEPTPGDEDRLEARLLQAALHRLVNTPADQLSLRQVAGNLRPAGLMVAFKLFLHPFVVWLLVTQVIVLEPFWANAAVIFSAGPVGANVYIFAQHYEAGVESASSAIVISTGGLSSRRRTCLISHPTARPIPTPATTFQTKASEASSRLNDPVTTAATANR